VKALVFGEKLEQAAGLTSYIAAKLKPAETYTAVVGEPAEQDVQALGRAGADKIVSLPGSILVEGPAQTAAVLSEAVKEFGADLLAVYASKTGIEAAARTARRLNAAYASEAITLELVNGGVQVSRLVLGGGFLSTVMLKTRPCVVSLKTLEEGGVFSKNPSVVKYSPNVEAPKLELVEMVKPEASRVELEKADVIVAVGRGFKKKEDLAMAEELARLLGGEVGCSRPISGDLKWLSEERHIGLSGKRVRPKLYIALGISGQVQHLVGMRDSRTVIAVNTDANAPMSTESDYFFVADIYKILPPAIQRLREKLGR
jgi:electron transfer flavoprotein alpha subunit